MKSPRSLVDIFLLLGALLLGAYLAMSAGGPTTSELNARKNNLLPAFLEEDVQRIEISSPGLKSMLLLRRDSRIEGSLLFFLGEKGQMEADAAATGELLRTLSYATLKRSWSREADNGTTDFGFNTPKLEMRIQAGARSYRVLIGGEAASPNGSLYVEVEGRNVESRLGVVDAALLMQLQKSDQEYQNSLLFPYSKSRTSLLSIDSSDGNAVLVSDGSSFLVSHGGETSLQYRAKRSRSDLIFFQLARAKMLRYLDEEEVKAALDKEGKRPVLTLRQESPDGPPVQIRLGGSCPGDPDSILAYKTLPEASAGCVTRTILAALRYSESELTDRSALYLNSDEIDHLLIRQQESSLDLIRDDANFRLGGRASDPVPAAAAREFLDELSSAMLEILDPDQAPQGKAWGSIIAKGQSPATYDPRSREETPSERIVELKLDLYRDQEPGGAVIVKRLDDGIWLRVPPTHAWAFSTDDAWARKRKLSSWKEEDIQSVNISQPRAGEFMLMRKELAFELKTEGATVKADSDLSHRLLDELSHLEARRFHSPRLPRPEGGLVQVEFTLNVEKGKTSVETLWLGRRTRGGYLAWASFAEGSFVLPLATRIIVETPLFDRLPVALDPANILELEISLEGRRYRFDRAEDGLHAAGGLALTDMASPLETALGEIQVISSMPAAEASSFSTKKVRMTLAGRRLRADDTSETFTLHYGESISWRGKAVAPCWLNDDKSGFLVSEASLYSLFDLL